VGENGTVLHYTQGDWQNVSSPTNASLYSVAMANAENGWVVGSGSIILHYTDGAWQIVDLPGQFPQYSSLNTVAVNSEKDAWAMGYGGAILHYTEGAMQSDVNSAPPFEEFHRYP
jgi:photosystem II stability/assembly factor-like uncharacterized protein